MPHSRSHSNVVLACSACDLMDVLTNLDPCRRRGSFRTCLRSASRVTRPVFAPDHHPCVDSRVLLMGELMLYRDRCGDVPSEQGSTPSGMALHCTRAKVTKDAVCSPCVTAPPGGALSHCPYITRGCPHTPSRGAVWGKDESRWHSAWD
jgi:hypothetical protein